MARKPSTKKLINTRIASGYGGWIYCDHCGENIGYLCYVTYDNFKFSYKCKCGSQGHIHIAFGDVENTKVFDDKLISIKNRLCCPSDKSPLLTILGKKLDCYQYEIACVNCHTKYTEEKI